MEVFGEFNPTLNLSFHRGTPTVYANITYAESARFSFSWGNCTLIGHPAGAYCNRGLNVMVSGYALVRDVSSGTSYFSSTWFSYWQAAAFDDLTCTSSSGCSTSAYPANGSGLATSHVGSFSWTFPFLTGMTKGDTYELAIYVDAALTVQYLVSNEKLTGFSGVASLNLASGGNGVVLTSVVET
ncbi:MAG: hypothetical protein L3K19_05700 [Thermoplasmata archaeon]|nr:hypothetical protein [Thermoplasmata archaeon]